MLHTRPSIADKRKVFHRLHDSGCFVLPNPWDVGSARYLQGLGFKALATTSAGFAWSHGHADGRMSRDRVLDHPPTWSRRPTCPSTQISRMASAPMQPPWPIAFVSLCSPASRASPSKTPPATLQRHSSISIPPSTGYARPRHDIDRPRLGERLVRHLRAVVGIVRRRHRRFFWDTAPVDITQRLCISRGHG